MLLSEGYVATEDGVRLFFQKLGSGPNPIIIPNAIHMLDSFQHLAERRTIIFFDLRNRGSSDAVASATSGRGIHQDVDDLDAVRRHFGFETVDVIGHSYVGLMVILFALKYPANVRRLVQIGPSPIRASKTYPAHLTGADETLAVFIRKLGQLQQEGQPQDPQEACRKVWPMLRTLMVAPADAGKIQWTPCNSPNEASFMTHWTQEILPSITALNLSQEELSTVTAPVLTIHGTRDRQAPYGGGREWVLRLPNARLVTIENAAHVPWIEAPEKVFGSIKRFLGGDWPEAAEEVKSVDPAGGAMA